MSLSALSGVDTTSLVRQLLASLQTGGAKAGGADDFTAPANASDPSSCQPPPKPDTASANRFSADTLASLLDVQQQPPSASDIAAKLISGSDADGSGGLSLDEIGTALGQGATSTAGSAATASTSSPLADAFKKLDANGDGQLDASELTAGLQAKAAHGHRHHHHAYAQANEAQATTSAATPTTPATPVTDTSGTPTTVDVAA